MLLQNSGTGACCAWMLNGTAMVDDGFMGWTPPGSRWQSFG